MTGLQGPRLNQALKRSPGAGCCRPVVPAVGDMADRALPRQAGHAGLLGSRDAFACRHIRTEWGQPLRRITPGSAFLPHQSWHTAPRAPAPPARHGCRPTADGTGTLYSSPSAATASCSLVQPGTPRCVELLPWPWRAAAAASQGQLVPKEAALLSQGESRAPAAIKAQPGRERRLSTHCHSGPCHPQHSTNRSQAQLDRAQQLLCRGAPSPGTQAPAAVGSCSPRHRL